MEPGHVSRLIIQDNDRDIQTEPGSLNFLYQAQDVSLYNAAKVKCLKLSLVSHNATIEKFKWNLDICHVSLYKRIIAKFKQSPAH